MTGEPGENISKPNTPTEKGKPLRRKYDWRLVNSKRKLQTAEERAESAEVDSLTGLPIRAAFDRRLEQEAERISRGGSVTTVVILDADKLKQINDSRGHPAGDKYLQLIAEAIKAGLRRDLDFAARTGGDEFGILLPDTNLDGAEKMWSDTLNPAFIERGIAISAGAAEIDPRNPNESVKKADNAMYGAKYEPTRGNQNMLFLYVSKKK